MIELTIDYYAQWFILFQQFFINIIFYGFFSFYFQVSYQISTLQIYSHTKCVSVYILVR